MEKSKRTSLMKTYCSTKYVVGSKINFYAYIFLISRVLSSLRLHELFLKYNEVYIKKIYIKSHDHVSKQFYKVRYYNGPPPSNEFITRINFSSLVMKF